MVFRRQELLQERDGRDPVCKSRMRETGVEDQDEVFTVGVSPVKTKDKMWMGMKIHRGVFFSIPGNGIQDLVDVSRPDC